MRTGEENLSKETRLKLDYCCEIGEYVKAESTAEALRCLETLEKFIRGEITYDEANY
jgi:hypothetical protein